MRAPFVLLIAGLVALGAVLVGCSGDDDQQQQGQQAQETGETAQGAQSDQASDQAAGSDRATAVQRDQPAQQSSTQAAAQQVQSDQTAADDAAAPLDGVAAEAAAAFEAWSENLESFVFEVLVDFDLGLFAFESVSRIAAQLNPYTVWATIDASSLFGQAMIGADEEADDAAAAAEPLIMHLLISDEMAFISMPQVDGWIDLGGEFEEVVGELTTLLGADSEEFADPASFGQALGCLQTLGGSVATASHEGEAVWVVECVIDVADLDQATISQLGDQGIEIPDSGLESLDLRLTISQASGAPLMMETTSNGLDAFGLSEDDSDQDAPGQFYVSSVATLISWNETIEFPTPEPLIDGSFLDAFGESLSSSGASSGSDQGSSSAPPELLSTGELLDLATEWVAAADELDMQFVAQAVIDGEARLASTIVRGSRTQGAFETLVNIDDASTFRLLWNRDGIWTSDSEVGGQPVWAPSNPALLGFAGQTVDDLLANPDRLYLEPFTSLLDFAWLTRTIEGGGPAVYELVIETGYMTPEDPFFNEIVMILKDETAELLAESVYIESIDHYSTTWTVVGENGQVTSQVTTAEFQTDAGRVELVSSLNIVSNGPIEFSTPTK